MTKSEKEIIKLAKAYKRAYDAVKRSEDGGSVRLRGKLLQAEIRYLKAAQTMEIT